MSELFYLIDTLKSPTREETSTIGREVGEEFLRQYYPDNRIKYCGYIVAKGQIVPFWRFDVVPNSVAQNMHQLARNGYIGMIERIN